MSRRWLRVAGAWVLVLGMLAGLWWWRAPRTYRLVRTIPLANGDVFAPCTAGFLLEEGRAHDYVLYDWRDGRERWRVAAPAHAPWAVSTDGHYLAICTLVNRRLEVTTYHDGRCVGKASLNANYSAEPQMLNDGQVFVAIARSPYAEIERLVVVQGARVIATGILPGATRPSIAPDGMSLLYRSGRKNILASMTIAHGHLRFAQKQFISESFSYLGGTFSSASFVAPLSPGGHLLTFTGAVYGPRGMIRKQDGWEWGASSVGGCYALGRKAGTGTTRFKVLNLAQNRIVGTMTIRSETADGFFAICADGRHALLSSINKIPGTIGKVIDRIRWLRKRLGNGVGVIGVYTFDGVMRGMLRVPLGDGSQTRLAGRTYSSISMTGPAPDGRSLALVGEHDGKRELILLRY